MKKLWKKNKPLESYPEESENGLSEVFGDVQNFPFAYRLACEEGPRHHASANSTVLNALLKCARELAKETGISIAPYDGDVCEVQMHRPPHHQHLNGSGIYPIDLPVDLIVNLAGGDEQRASEMIDALTEGPPHHVMANIMTMHMAEVLMALIQKIMADDMAGA